MYKAGREKIEFIRCSLFVLYCAKFCFTVYERYHNINYCHESHDLFVCKKQNYLYIFVQDDVCKKSSHVIRR